MVTRFSNRPGQRQLILEEGKRWCTQRETINEIRKKIFFKGWCTKKFDLFEDFCMSTAFKLMSRRHKSTCSISFRFDCVRIALRQRRQQSKWFKGCVCALRIKVSRTDFNQFTTIPRCAMRRESTVSQGSTRIETSIRTRKLILFHKRVEDFAFSCPSSFSSGLD